AAMRVVLAVHDVDPNNPGTLAAPATVLYDDVLPTPPGFATYALANGPNLHVSVSFTRLQHVVYTEVRSLVPGGEFHTRLTGNFADGGECYVTSSAELRFYPPYPPQINEQVVVAYRSSARAMARVQDTNSIAAHHHGSDSGRRSYVRRLKLPRSEEHTSELHSLTNLVCRLLLEKNTTCGSRSCPLPARRLCDTFQLRETG